MLQNCSGPLIDIRNNVQHQIPKSYIMMIIGSFLIFFPIISTQSKKKKKKNRKNIKCFFVTCHLALNMFRIKGNFSVLFCACTESCLIQESDK